MNMSIDNRYCNRFSHIGRPIFSVNRSGAYVYNPTIFGNAHVRCYTRNAPLTQSATQVGSLPLHSSMLWLFHEAITSPIIVFTSIPAYFAGTNSIAIVLITVKDLFFFSASATSDNLPFLLVVIRWLPNDLSIPCAPENMSHENIHNSLFLHLDVI